MKRRAERPARLYIFTDTSTNLKHADRQYLIHGAKG